MSRPTAPRDVQVIQTFGWRIQGVLGDEQVPPWAYTVGLWHTFGHPELVVCGLSMDDSARVLNSLGRAVRGGATLDALVRVGDDGSAALFGLAAVHDNWHVDILVDIPDFYQGRPPPVRQVIWADSNDAFPWDADFSGDRDRQPRLWLPKDSHPLNVWRDFDALTDGPCPGGACGCGYRPD